MAQKQSNINMYLCVKHIVEIRMLNFSMIHKIMNLAFLFQEGGYIWILQER